MTAEQSQQDAGSGRVRVYPDPGSARGIHKWMSRSCGIRGLGPRFMYATVLNDTRNPDFAYERRRGALYDVQSVVPGIVNGNLVLVLDAPDLVARHEHLVDAGYRHSEGQFTPCLTIKHGGSRRDLAKAQEKLDELVNSLTQFQLYRETWSRAD